ncbi:MAG: 50S ribosomal protein L35 [Bacteroidetes bacterium]|nr:50S ribosomal protein L35 [Bacteroidota bacterium]
MPKMKTTSGAKKRFQTTGKGKLLRKKSTNRHLLSSKTNRRKRHLGGKHEVAQADEKRVLHLLAKR